MLAAGFPADGLRASGRATIDVEQYRVRGRFVLTLTPQRDLVFEITSTTMLGGNREDAVLSFYADTLRVLDREGGNYYEGADVDARVADGLGRTIDLGELLRRVTGRIGDCRRLSGVARAADGSRVTGRIDGRDFEVRFAGGRVASARWPLPGPGKAGRGTVEATYDWRSNGLAGLVLYVPEERWRIKLVAEVP